MGLNKYKPEERIIDDSVTVHIEGYEKVDEEIIPEFKEVSQNSEKSNGNPIRSAANCENLWKRDDVSKDGWTCEGVTDLGASVGVCEMCGHQIIRYVHHMAHPNYRSLDVGCICAGKMEGNIEKHTKKLFI